MRNVVRGLTARGTVTTAHKTVRAPRRRRIARRSSRIAHGMGRVVKTIVNLIVRLPIVSGSAPRALVAFGSRATERLRRARATLETSVRRNWAAREIATNFLCNELTLPSRESPRDVPRTRPLRGVKSRRAIDTWPSELFRFR